MLAEFQKKVSHVGSFPFCVGKTNGMVETTIEDLVVMLYSNGSDWKIDARRRESWRIAIRGGMV